MNNNQQPKSELIAENFSVEKHRVGLGPEDPSLVVVKNGRGDGKDVMFSGRPFTKGDGDSSVIPMPVQRSGEEGKVDQEGWFAVGIREIPSDEAGGTPRLFYLMTKSDSSAAKYVSVEQQQQLLGRLREQRRKEINISAGSAALPVKSPAKNLRPAEYSPEGHDTMTPEAADALRAQVQQADGPSFQSPQQPPKLITAEDVQTAMQGVRPPASESIAQQESGSTERQQRMRELNEDIEEALRNMKANDALENGRRSQEWHHWNEQLAEARKTKAALMSGKL